MNDKKPSHRPSSSRKLFNSIKKVFFTVRQQFREAISKWKGKYQVIREQEEEIRSTEFHEQKEERFPAREREVEILLTKFREQKEEQLVVREQEEQQQLQKKIANYNQISKEFIAAHKARPVIGKEIFREQMKKLQKEREETRKSKNTKKQKH